MYKLYNFVLYLLLSLSLAAQERFSVLVFSKTEGFRHASISSGIAAIKTLGQENNFKVVASEDATAFTLSNLSLYKTVIFLCTTGDVLDATQQVAFEKYIAQGGGFVGIHAASDTEYDWPWYGELVGAYFASHPPGTPSAFVKVSDHVHPSTKHLPDSWYRTDEWYNFKTNPRGKVHVLATVDETSYSGGTMRSDHPIAWCRNYSGGRSWYTAGGHTDQSYSEPDFVKHILGGILYAAGEIQGDFDATVESNFQLTVLHNDPNQPIMLEVLNDGRVLYIERGGTLNIYNPTTSLVKPAGRVNVNSQLEDGLLGIVLDPDFDTNHWIYLFYSPFGTQEIQRVSRFVFENDLIQNSTEKILLTIPVQRKECCHSGGDLKFDGQGNLYIAIGDNTNPFFSDGYSPLDESPGRANFDAQRTAGNTKDLRGKILRIKPTSNGTHTIPEGNLFTDTTLGRPEIFTMGNRNPFRISTDTTTGYLYWGEVGPDAGANSARGPKGYDEFNKTKTAGNFGWPYCIADNKSYADYNYATTNIGPLYNCNAPVNNSPNNTGAINLPPARSAWIWYPYLSSPEFPAFGEIKGRTAMAGPVYHFDSTGSAKGRLPAYFDKSVFVYDWSNNWVKEIKQDAQGVLTSMNSILTSFTFKSPIDMKAGPDGSIYIVEYGTGYFTDNPDARIIKISFEPGGRNPVAIIKASHRNGTLPLNVTFFGNESYDEDPSNTLTYFWDFQNDGVEDATGITATYNYATEGIYNAKLRVSDNTGRQAFSVIQIVAGNSQPVAEIIKPFNGGFFDWSDSIAYKIKVTDNEDGSTENGSISCSDVSILPAIGHNTHGHDLNLLEDCQGVLKSPSGHGDPAAGDNIFFVINASYKDKGLNGNPAFALTGTATSALRPKRVQAEYYSKMTGVSICPASDVAGGGTCVMAGEGDYISFDPVNLAGIHQVTYRLAAFKSAYIEMHADSVTGTLLSKRLIIPAANSMFDFYTTPVTDPGGPRKIFIVFKSKDGFADSLVSLNWIDYYGNGITIPHPEKQGLMASYFKTPGLDQPQTMRYEPLISHNWEKAVPFTGLNADGFSILWKGYLTATLTGNYIFSSPVLNGTTELILDGIGILKSPAKEVSFPLTAGTKYPIQFTYTKDTGSAAVQLQWKYGNLESHVIPQSFLSPVRDILLDQESDNYGEDKIIIYPNPAYETLIIETRTTKNYKVGIYDLSGQLIAGTEQEFSGTKYLDIGKVTPGLYLIKISRGELDLIKKIVVSR